tara:strand:+ start:92 stop:481 length:390 start_codon:yes stop_codon:yes gene_type:complete
MKVAKTQYLLFLFLLIFCGQTVAMPLLSCCSAMSPNSGHGNSPHDGHMYQHQHMSMNASEQQMSDQMDMQEAENTQCDLHCEFCGVASLALPYSENQQKILLAQVNPSFYTFLLGSRFSENPFRPPIFA